MNARYRVVPRASVKTTLDGYSHLWPDTDESAGTAQDGRSRPMMLAMPVARGGMRVRATGTISLYRS